MAKLDGTRYPGFEKGASESWEDHAKRMQKHLAILEAESAKVDPNGKDLVGAIISFHVADGGAVYRVSKNEPLTLQHVPFGDAYQADAATIRGVNKNTVRTQLMQKRAFAQMGDSNKDFYASLKVGQTVHYHNSFGSWIRCTVVRGKAPNNPDGPEQNVLKPVALVGDWRPFDLPRRMPDGSVHLGYHAESVRDGKVMSPHESMLWESGKMGPRYEDPTGLPEVSLEVPGMSDDEEKKAALWRKVNRLRALVNDHREQDPQAILDALKASLEAA